MYSHVGQGSDAPQHGCRLTFGMLNESHTILVIQDNSPPSPHHQRVRNHQRVRTGTLIRDLLGMRGHKKAPASNLRRGVFLGYRGRNPAPALRAMEGRSSSYHPMSPCQHSQPAYRAEALGRGFQQGVRGGGTLQSSGVVG